MLTAGSCVMLYFLCRRIPTLNLSAALASKSLAAMSGIQVAMGIGALLFHVPTGLAAAHQAGSLTLLSIALWFVHALRPLPVLSSIATSAAAPVMMRSKVIAEAAKKVL